MTVIAQTIGYRNHCANSIRLNKIRNSPWLLVSILFAPMVGTATPRIWSHSGATSLAPSSQVAARAT
jgi:hypothetical protein